MANVKKAILKKKIGEIVYDLMVKTTAEMVYVTDEETLKAHLATADASLADAQDKLTKLLGSDDATSITKQIGALRTELTKVTDDMKNAEEPGSLAALIKANTDAIAAINAGTTGILDTAKKYTDDKLALPVEYANMKAYVDAVEKKLQGSIAGAFHFKGSVDYVDKLPMEHDLGDVYQVKYAGQSSASGKTPLNAEFAWDGSAWVELGSIVDLSAYLTGEQVGEAINAAKQAVTTDLEGKIATAKGEAIEAAATDATTKANNAKTGAEATASAALAAAVEQAGKDINAAKTAAIEAAAADATEKANTAQSNAEATAAGALSAAKSELEGKITGLESGKARILVADVGSQPVDLTEADLWIATVV